MEVIYGIHPVTEALESRGRTIDYIGVARDRHDSRIQKIIDQARHAGISVRFVPREDLSRLAQDTAHQGVIALVSARKYADLDDLLRHRRGEHAFLLILDGVEDPHNLGAIVRTADGAGVDGVIVPERRAVGVTGTVAKAAAGATEYLPIARVTNVNRTIEDLKSRNIWIVGLDERGTQAYDELDYNMDCALVLGAEGAGVHEQVRKKCDFLIRIPMLGHVPSLNVSVAAAVVMYEVARQRRKPIADKKQIAPTT
jgi:23S rRNA (guanosine2251-2'-O)-methyltransferase